MPATTGNFYWCFVVVRNQTQGLLHARKHSVKELWPQPILQGLQSLTEPFPFFQQYFSLINVCGAPVSAGVVFEKSRGKWRQEEELQTAGKCPEKGSQTYKESQCAARRA